MIESVWEYPTRRRFFPVNRGLSGNFDREGFAQDCVLRQPSLFELRLAYASKTAGARLERGCPPTFSRQKPGEAGPGGKFRHRFAAVSRYHRLVPVGLGG